MRKITKFLNSFGYSGEINFIQNNKIHTYKNSSLIRKITNKSFIIEFFENSKGEIYITDSDSNIFKIFKNKVTKIKPPKNDEYTPIFIEKNGTSN